MSFAAVNTLNGTDLGGRRIAVREDREDRDVKQSLEGEEGAAAAPRPPRAPRGRGRGRGRGPRAPIEGEPSGFQVGGSRITVIHEISLKCSKSGKALGFSIGLQQHKQLRALEAAVAAVQ